MTAREIQNAIFRNHVRVYELMMPNYTPRGWFECDVFGISKSGYFHEFEVKMTVSDFRADRSKALAGTRCLVPSEDGPRLSRRPGPSKHQLLAERASVGPSRFSFVTPAGLLKVEDIPDWAGLWEAHDRGSSRLSVRLVKSAPEIHRQKPDVKIAPHVRSVAYYRYWQSLIRHADEVRQLKRKLQDAEQAK